MQGRLTAFLLVLIGAMSYGVLSTIVKLAYADGWADSQVTSSQLTVGAILMWALLLCIPAAWGSPWKGPWIQLSCIGIFGLATSTILYNRALLEMDASMAIVLLFQFTWITVAMESIAEKKLPKRKRILAVILIMIGTWLSVNGPAADWSKFTVIGLICGLGSGATYALFMFWSGRVETSMHPVMKAAIMLTAALLPLYVLFPPQLVFEAGGKGIGGLLIWGLLLGLLGQVIPTVSYMIGIPRLGSSTSAVVASMELPVAVITAFLLLQETVQGVQWFGMISILTGILMAEREASS